ncbi:glycerol kinase GlpK [Candidatus Poribacteria bacterium]|nr:glycerol kinase GlpK [Candidatus Poribacteria bacterium]
MANYIIAIDQGTTGTTVLLVDEIGQIKYRNYREFTQYYPRPGWVEHDAEEIWNVTVHLLDDLLREVKHQQSGVDVSRILGIGITNQRETTVVWDRNSGKPIYNAIVWQCRRTADVCARLRDEGLEPMVKEKTGLVIDPYFSATKIAWILDNVAGARQAAMNGKLCFGTIDTWLLWNLMGGKVHATDYTNASRTMLFDIGTLKWDEDLLKAFKAPAPILPDICASSHIFGYTHNAGPLPDGIPIAGIAGDQQAALFGQLCFEVGMAKNTYGTGCFLILNTGEQRIHSQTGLLTTLACGPGLKPVYALEGSVFIAGAAVQWLRDGLKIINSATETEELALKVNDSNGTYIVPAFTGLGAPYWNPDARGAILGLTRGTTREHIVRATLEAIAFQTADVVEAMIVDSQIPLQQLRVDGGAVANNFLMQFQADILNIDVERPAIIETTALGAAFLAGLAVGLWNNTDELKICRQTDKIFSPQISPTERERLLSGWKDAVRKVIA